MYRRIHVLILIILLMALSSGPPSSISAQEPTCPGLVNHAFELVDRVCDGATNNEACYGHARLDAVPQPHARSLVFSEAGDIANVADLQSLRLSAMDLDSGWWGVGVIRVRANVPNANARQDASILLFGDVGIKNAVQTPAITDEVTIWTAGGASARVRTAPYDGLVIAALLDGQVATATGRTDDGSWVRIELPDTARPGWIHASLLAKTDALLDLAVVAPNSAEYGSMQAFTFTSGQHDAACSEAPNSGLMIQTPEGEAKVTFLINEVSINLGSTAFVQAASGNDMSIYLIEGDSQVTTHNVSYTMLAGTVITIPLDEAAAAAGAPSLPAAYDLAHLAALPVAHLDRPVTIAPPLDEVSLAKLNRANLGTDDDDSDEDEDTGDDEPIGDGGVIGEPGGPGGPDPKITICHNGKSTTTISVNAWPAHQEHGDTEGPCPEG